MRAFNNTEQLENIIYEDATNENVQSRVSQDQRVSSGSSPVRHDARAYSIHSKDTGSFANNQQRQLIEKQQNILDVINEDNLPAYDAERDEILIDPQPSGRDEVGSDFLDTRIRKNLGIFRKMSSEMKSKQSLEGLRPRVDEDGPFQIENLNRKLAGSANQKENLNLPSLNDLSVKSRKLDYDELLEQIGLASDQKEDF